METNQKLQQQMDAIKKIVYDKHRGLQPLELGGKDYWTTKIRVEDHEDLLQLIAALLEVCVLSLEEEPRFYNKTLSHKAPNHSIKRVLELAIELLPYDDIFKYEQVLSVLRDLNRQIE